MFGIKISIALHCARAPSLAFRCSQRGQDVSSNDTWPFWLSIKHFAHKIIPILFKILASALFLKYSKNFANFSPDILIKHILIKKKECTLGDMPTFDDLSAFVDFPTLNDLPTFVDFPP